MKRWIPLVFMAALLGSAYVYYQGTEASGQSDDKTFTIETQAVEQGDVARIVSASGSVRALTTVEVGSQISGQVTELAADFNSVVKQNDIVARIDPESFQTRVTSAEADVRSAQANIDVLKAQIERAQANLDLYEKDFKRQTELFQQKLIPRSSLEDTERQLTVGRSDLNVSKAQLRTGEASLAQRKAALASAEVDLERTIIRSPIDGVVIERSVDVGQTVAASLSAPVLFRIAQDLDDIRIDADVVEADIGGIDTGDTVSFVVDAYPNEEFTGTVEQVRLAAQELQNVVTYTVVIAAKNSGGRLLPGMTANVEITAEQRQDVLRIAESVVRFGPNDNGPKVNDAEASQARGPGGGRGNRAGEWLSQLGLDDERKQQVELALRESMQELRSSMSSGMQQFDRNRMRQMFANRTAAVLKKYLSSEEYKQYEKLQNARSSERRIELYQREADGSLTKKTVVVGLSDGSYTQIIRGAEVGDEFIERVLDNKERS